MSLGFFCTCVSRDDGTIASALWIGNEKIDYLECMRYTCTCTLTLHSQPAYSLHVIYIVQVLRCERLQEGFGGFVIIIPNQDAILVVLYCDSIKQ